VQGNPRREGFPWADLPVAAKRGLSVHGYLCTSHHPEKNNLIGVSFPYPPRSGGLGSVLDEVARLSVHS